MPLFHEDEIASRLLQRMMRLDYPKAQLEIILITEEEDRQTAQVIAQTDLPAHFKTIVVPKGSIATKPRALNYALPETRGEIIGIYDAEDAPAPDQLRRVAARFEAAPKSVGCLQGALDYYNPHSNWIARCFTIEYASWFRIVLPGLAKLGLVVPLGGTTLFIRRAVIEQVNGWDAHNVTEDADLGVKIARAGYVTELIDTTTYEEANNKLWPWVRQRSRWLKGYFLTYLVHMRRPAELRRDLGLYRFVGFQVFFLGTILQFILAPVLWSFWLVLFGVPHPLSIWVDQPILDGLIVLFLGSLLTDIFIGLIAVDQSGQMGLRRWVPTMVFYFPLATLAVFRGLASALIDPFYWDKTAHGHSNDTKTTDQGLGDLAASNFSRVTKATEI